MGVELGRRDHLRELLHVGGLDVHDVWHRRVKEETRKEGASRGDGSVPALLEWNTPAPAHTMAPHGKCASKQAGTAVPGR